jgi:uncharacterized protein YegJ (DUF2314 family)
LEEDNRVLSAYVGSGYYHYSTYDVLSNSPSVVGNVNYGEELEG